MRIFSCLVTIFFWFHFVHWILFFAAHRMYHDDEFAEFVLQDRRYARFPENIEFYSGIDRRRTGLLQRLRDDLRELNKSVNGRIDVSEEFNPYDLARWSPSQERSEIRELVGVTVARHEKGAKSLNRKLVEKGAKIVLDNVRQRRGEQRRIYR